VSCNSIQSVEQLCELAVVVITLEVGTDLSQCERLLRVM
jgi:hypothetical protein